MAKTVIVQTTGGPEVLAFEDRPVGEPGAGEVKLRIQAVGLNRAEIMYMGGYYLEAIQVPSRIGYEAAGVVEAVGPGGDASWVGKKIGTMPGFSMNKYGLLAEEAIVPVSVLGEYPGNLSIVEAAAVWMQYTTAYGALVMHGGLKKDDFVIVTAASSSVGLAAIQMVKGEGAVAIATTRTSAKRDELLSLGADYVIATEEEDLYERVKEITVGKFARLIFDPITGPFLEQLAKVAAVEGIIFEYGALALAPTPFPLIDALNKGLSIRGYVLQEVFSHPDRLAAARKYIYERLADGRFVPKIDKVFRFEDTVKAYEYLASNVQVGKVVITL